MLRIALAALAMLAASACSYGSAVNLAPMSARLSNPVIGPGDYCEVKGEAAPFIVAHEDCAPITWDQATRTYTLVDPDKEDGHDESIQSAVISLGSGLYAAQIDTTADKDGASHRSADRYQLEVLFAQGNAFAMIPPLDDDALRMLTKRHAQLKFKNDPAGRPYIAAGSADRIKAFLRDAAQTSLGLIKERKDEDRDKLSIGVLDAGGAGEHPANDQQTKDIEAILKLAKSMTPDWSAAPH
ncbi:MAG TPA: hypothetical protein VG942_16170 [Hyphomonadaceae bacterium]|nr:hypothetical protein [Hyphomonadaceae bacterium]